MLRGNIAATSLKMLLKNLYSVKCNDKLNVNVLTLSLWENFWWGLIYFDQFINQYMGSGKFYILLDDFNEFQNLLKASIGMEKKIPVNSGLFWKLP